MFERRMGNLYAIVTGYLRLGIGEATPPEEARRIQLLNVMGVVMCLACLPYMPLFYALGLTSLSIALIPIALGYVSVPLISKRNPNTARVVFFTNFAGAVFVYAGCLGREAGIQLLFFAAACIPVLVTSIRQRGLIVYGVSVSAVAYAALLITNFHVFGAPQLDPAMAGNVYAPIVYTTLIILVVCMVYFATLSDHITARLDRRNADLQLVLDSISQGLVAVNRDGEISEERSAKANLWLSGAPAGTPFADIVGRRSPDDALAWTLSWEALLDDFLPLELALEQLPSRIDIDGRPVGVECLPLYERGKSRPWTRIMLMLTDVSAEIEAARADRVAREDMALIKAATRDRDGVRRFMEETDRLVSVITDPDTIAINERRTLHTLKGNCGLFGLESIAGLAHRLEDTMQALDVRIRDDQREELRRAWQDTRGRIGPFVFSEAARGCVVSVTELDAVVEQLSRTNPDAARQVDGWRHTPAVTVLNRLGKQARSLMDRVDGRPLEVEIDAGDVRFNEDRMQRVFASMSHVVRNAVDHGLRSVPRGRDPKLRLWTCERGGVLTVGVVDNGEGIDWDKLRAKALDLGLPATAPRDLQDALFTDGLSTREQVSDVSGRGVGMSAVKAEVEAIGGRIEVRSHRGEGTEFRFEFPLDAAPPSRLRVAAE